MDNEYFDPTKMEEEKIEAFNKVLLAHQKEGVSMLEGNINDFIATITAIARHNPKLMEMNQNTENEISILTYLRDKYKIDTAKKAFDMLAEGEVDPKIVQLWIEEGMTDSANIEKSIDLGYPELKEKLKKTK